MLFKSTVKLYKSKAEYFKCTAKLQWCKAKHFKPTNELWKSNNGASEQVVIPQMLNLPMVVPPWGPNWEVSSSEQVVISQMLNLLMVAPPQRSVFLRASDHLTNVEPPHGGTTPEKSKWSSDTSPHKKLLLDRESFRISR